MKCGSVLKAFSRESDCGGIRKREYSGVFFVVVGSHVFSLRMEDVRSQVCAFSSVKPCDFRYRVLSLTAVV